MIRTFKDCPFCGHDLERQDIMDTLYPANKRYTQWNVVCTKSSGGCDATVYGDTEEEAFENWNRRVK